MNYSDFLKFYSKNIPDKNHSKYINDIINKYGLEAGICSCLSPQP